MSKDFPVCGAKECLASEITFGQKAIVQATAMADIQPLAIFATSIFNVFRTLVYFALPYARNNLRQCFAVQIAIRILQQIIIAEATARHNITSWSNGKEIILAITAEHTASGATCGDIAGNLYEIRFCYFTLIVVKP